MQSASGGQGVYFGLFDSNPVGMQVESQRKHANWKKSIDPSVKAVFTVNMPSFAFDVLFARSDFSPVISRVPVSLSARIFFTKLSTT